MPAKSGLYKIDDGKLTRLKKHCPKCGEGVFMAEHKDRISCGSCGYTEFKKVEPNPEPKAKPKAAPAKPKPEPKETSVPSLLDDSEPKEEAKPAELSH